MRLPTSATSAPACRRRRRPPPVRLLPRLRLDGDVRHQAEVIRGPNVAALAFGLGRKREPGAERLAAQLGIGATNVDVVDPPRRLVRERSEAVASIESVTRAPVASVDPGVGEVHRLALYA